MEDVIIRYEGDVLRITLNRPGQLNALTLEMSQQIVAALQNIRAGAACIVLDASTERAFAGGGDIKAMRAGDDDFVHEFLRFEYLMDYLVSTCEIPVVSLMTGITMGGGIGLSGHASHRVVTENSMLAMPEVRIGIVPDVGGHYLLANAPGKLGEFFALTARSMSAAEAIYMGFADCFVSERVRGEFIADLLNGVAPDTAIAKRQSDPGAHELVELNAWWQPVLEQAEREAGDNPVAIMQNLISLLEQDNTSLGAEVAEEIRGMCPVSLAISLHQIRRVRANKLSLLSVLTDDLATVVPLATRANFSEGVRARLIDKDNDPHWNPATIEDLRESDIVDVLERFGKPHDTLLCYLPK